MKGFVQVFCMIKWGWKEIVTSVRNSNISSLASRYRESTFFLMILSLFKILFANLALEAQNYFKLDFLHSIWNISLHLLFHRQERNATRHIMSKFSAKQSSCPNSNPLPKSTKQTLCLKHMLHHLLLWTDTTNSI